jgi:RNA polymerase sigma factor (sigma-70 family)
VNIATQSADPPRSNDTRPATDRSQLIAKQLAEHARYIRAIGWRRGLTHFDIDDLVQDIAVRCLVSSSGVDWSWPQGRLIRRIAWCRLFDQRRRWARREAREHFIPDLDEQPGVSDEPGTEVVRREECARVRLRISQLEPKLRDVVRECYLEQRSIEAIALATQKPLETIRTRRKRGLQRLAITLR